MAAVRGRRWLVAVLLGVVAAAAPVPALGAPAETREVIVKPREPRPDVFFLAGRVKPGYERKPAILQRRNCGGCAWFGFEHFRTDGHSRFKRPVPDLRAGEREGLLPDQGAGLEGVRDGVLRDQLSRPDRLTVRPRARLRRRSRCPRR